MDNLNDLYYFVMVVKHRGFSAASRAVGIDKTRLSRSVAGLEKRLDVRLLQRSTRHVSLTEAGSKLYAHSLAVVEGAQSAYESVADLRREPSGLVRLTCPQVMAQSYLAPILPAYMAAHPKVRLELNAVDREVDLIAEGFDLALRARPQIEDAAGLIARPLGVARRVLVASPAFLDRYGRPDSPRALSELDTVSRPGDVQEGRGRWMLQNQGEEVLVSHTPRMLSDDLRTQLEAAIHGIGIALIPEPIVSASVKAGLLEVVMPAWAGAEHLIHLLYPRPRGMLPSVRSLIDYLSIHLPASIQERSVSI